MSNKHQNQNCPVIGCEVCKFYSDREEKRKKAHPTEVSTWDLIEKSMKLEFDLFKANEKSKKLEAALKDAKKVAEHYGGNNSNPVRGWIADAFSEKHKDVLECLKN